MRDTPIHQNMLRLPSLLTTKLYTSDSSFFSDWVVVCGKKSNCDIILGERDEKNSPRMKQKLHVFTVSMISSLLSPAYHMASWHPSAPLPIACMAMATTSRSPIDPHGRKKKSSEGLTTVWPKNSFEQKLVFFCGKWALYFLPRDLTRILFFCSCSYLVMCTRIWSLPMVSFTWHLMLNKMSCALWW